MFVDRNLILSEENLQRFLGALLRSFQRFCLQKLTLKE